MIKKFATTIARTLTSLPRYSFSTQPAQTITEARTQTTDIATVQKYSQKISKHRTVYGLYDMEMFELGDSTFVAPNATIVGEVYMGASNAIWHNVVIRGDLNAVVLDSEVSIGENSVLYTASNLPNGLPARLSIGKYCLIQPGCTLYSCQLGKNVFVGYNTVIMEGSIIGDGVILDPNSVVPPGRIIPPMQHWGGNPIKFIRDVEDRDRHTTRVAAECLVHKSEAYIDNFLPFNNAYLLKENDLPEDAIEFKTHRNPYQSIIQNDYNPRRTY